MNKIEELIAFSEVVKCGSISKAAERLGIVKSAVSRRLSDLENRLQVRLLVRSTKGIHITEAGQNFYTRVVTILTDLEDAELSITDAAANLSGTIKITAPVGITHKMLMPHFASFLKLHPELKFDIFLSDRVIDIVNEGFDLAIRAGTLADSRLVARRLTDLTRLTCASVEYLARNGEPTHPEQLSAHDGLVSSNVPESLYWGYRMPDSSTYTAKPMTRLRINDGESVVCAAAAGLGIAAVPEFISKQLLDEGVLKPILQDYPLLSGGLFALYPANRHLAHRVRILIDYLKGCFDSEA